MPPPFVKQTWTVTGVLLNMFGQGMVLSFPSILLPAISSPDSVIKADIHTASWLASCIGLSSIPGFLTSSFVMELYGRKLAHIAVMVPGCIGWILIWLSYNVPMLIIGRILCGFTAGSTVTLGAVVISEFTSPKNRGMFLNLKTAAVCLGNTAVHILGHFLAWKVVALTALIPHIIALLIIFTWPESPSWLASKKIFDLSEKSFYWLRGEGEESRRELEELFRAQKERSKNIQSTRGTKTVLDTLKILHTKSFMEPLKIIFFAGVLLETCGRHVFPAFALQIIEEVVGNKSHSFYYTLVIDSTISASVTLSSILYKIFKRRTLLFGSGFAALSVLACVCLYLYLSAAEIISKDRPVIPITLFCLYFILSNLGCTSMPLAFIGEIFPLEFRSSGTIASGFIISLLLMVGMQVTPYLLLSVKVHGTFAVFGSVMALSLIVLCFILPETKDRTLQQIEDYFRFGKSVDETVDEDDESKMDMIPYSKDPLDI